MLAEAGEMERLTSRGQRDLMDGILSRYRYGYTADAHPSMLSVLEEQCRRHYPRRIFYLSVYLILSTLQGNNNYYGVGSRVFS